MKLKKALSYLGLSKERKKGPPVRRTFRSGGRRKKSSKSVLWEKADDINKRVEKLLKLSELPFNIENITTLRSYSSKARAYARIWGLTKVWQLSLGIPAHYIIEVLSEKFDGLSDEKKDEVLLHELAHIPNNFSGSLIPHIRRGKRNFHGKVDRLIESVRMNSQDIRYQKSNIKI